MWQKNRIYALFIIIFTVLIITGVQGGKKKSHKLLKSSFSFKAAESYSPELKNYFSQELLQPTHIPIVKATFGLPNIETSYFHNGWIGIAGFPIIHPNDINDIKSINKIERINDTGDEKAVNYGELKQLLAEYEKKSSAWIHLLAELDPKFVVLPKSVTRLGGTLDSVKVVIMSTPWETTTVANYHPQYMIFSDRLIADKDKSQDPCIKCTENLKVTIKSGTHKVYFQERKATNKYIPFKFEATYQSDLNATDFRSDNPTAILFEEDTVSQNISALKNGSFWMVHKQGEKKTATLFWIINDQDLVKNLDEMTLIPGQKFLNLARAFGDEKWGKPGSNFRKMIAWNKLEAKQKGVSNKESYCNYSAKSPQPSSSEYSQLYPILTIDDIVAQKRPDSDTEENTKILHSSGNEGNNAVGEDFIDSLPPLSTEQQQQLFISFMRKNGLIHHPTETTARSIFQAMANIANYNQLLSLQQPERSLITANKLIHNSYDIAKTLKLALQELHAKLQNVNRNLLLIDEMITLFTTDTRPGITLCQTIDIMVKFCDAFLTSSSEGCQLGDRCVMRMFNLFALLYNVDVDNYTLSENIIPANFYNSPDGHYPLIKKLLKDHITTMPVIENEHYIVSFYFNQKDCFVYSTWLTFAQAKKIQQTLIDLTQDSSKLLHDISASPHVQSVIARITGFINIETLQFWFLQGYIPPGR
ncbi:MAG: hypothetical protein OXC48_08215 [Endozoicomonadaceae bacterium]|nr:hypothetical protein [Endozoicomonadaceae bacterium]